MNMLLPLKHLWEWFSVTKNQKALALIGATIAGLAYAGWTVFAHFNPPKKANTYTYEEYVNYLNKLEKNKEAEYARTSEGEVEKRHIIEIEIAAIRAKKADPKSFEDELSKIAELAKGLSNITSDIPSKKLDRAQEALKKGETATAEELFLKSYETGKTQAEAGTKQAAESAYYLGILEARKINYVKSYQYFREAIELQPDNPSYLNAAGGMAHKLGNYIVAEQLLYRSLME
ncbi:MAG: hypothetical protein ACYDIC_15760, partial [Desulfobaccales bacterium]